jgi:hypothetical protein
MFVPEPRSSCASHTVQLLAAGFGPSQARAFNYTAGELLYAWKVFTGAPRSRSALQAHPFMRQSALVQLASESFGQWTSSKGGGGSVVRVR